MRTLIYTTFFLVFLTFTQAFGANVEVNVELNPTGSFVIKTDKIQSKIFRRDGGLMAEKISVKVKNLSSDMELRDNHIKEKLEMEKYKTIDITNAKGTNGKGQATITIKSISKNIVFSYEEKGNTVEVKFDLSLKDFQFEGISYMGVGVEDKIKVLAILEIN